MRIPSATYRLQMRPQFGFAAAAATAPYLFDLGISHVYASPILRSRPGSPHGYDCVDPHELDPELGSAADWHHLVAQLRARDMGILQDIVPNHMAFHGGNPMLADVFEYGPASEYYRFFDICWDHPAPELRGRVMAPFLGARYDQSLRNGDIRLIHDRGGFAVTYGRLRFPLRLRTYLDILSPVARRLAAGHGDESPAYDRLADVLDELESLAMQVPPSVRRKHGRAVKHALQELAEGHAAVAGAISDELERLNGVPGDLDSFEALDRLLSRQHFRLCFWKTANEEINYRRFFDINELIALRQEEERVFADTHRLLADLTADDLPAGARIDHIDGLADPGQYLARLRRMLGDGAYILVEKILAPEEDLPSGWPVQGTTGYDFAHWLNALFVDRANEERFTEIYSAFSSTEQSFEECVLAAKKHIMATRLAGDLDNLARRVRAISGRKRFADNLTFKRLREALSEVLGRFPVYRTYFESKSGRDEDRDTVRTVVSKSLHSRPDLQVELEFVRELLLEDGHFNQPGEESEMLLERRRAIRTLQQLSTALMAKGFEDTALYRYHRLVSLNDVGSDPARFGCSLDSFHGYIARRAEHWPQAMNCTATHDSKRGEDVRARLNVLSEIPSEWKAHLDAWHDSVSDCRVRTGRGNVPDRNTEYLLYQILIGAWPPNDPVPDVFAGRIRAYMIKAAREAGEHTSWLDPQEEFEAGLSAFVERILTPSPRNGFLPAFVPFCKKVAFYGLFNSLSQCLLKLAAPGVPDIYQGAELPQLVLVDPDNRRPVDYDRRRCLLEAMGGGSGPDSPEGVRELLDNRSDGRIKLFVTARTLALRRRLNTLFQTGRYLPLQAEGRYRRNVVAFARTGGRRWCVAVVPRFLTSLVGENRDPLGTAVWLDTAVVLPPEAPRQWQNIFTGETTESGPAIIAAGDAFRRFPVALLTGEEVS